MVSVNVFELIVVAILRSAALLTLYDFETSELSGS